MLPFILTGRAVCDGPKADLHEAQTWELLHAGKRLLENPFG